MSGPGTFGNVTTLDWPTRVYYLADGRIRLFVNKHQDRLVLEYEGETEDSVTIILTRPKESKEGPDNAR